MRDLEGEEGGRRERRGEERIRGVVGSFIVGGVERY